MTDENLLTIPVNIQEECLIKVMGVGGGGGNAVNYLYQQNIPNVSFLVCNTDRQAMSKLSVPAKLQLGEGLGAGGQPEVAADYAEQSREYIREALNDGTRMLFIAAGMGGGTGTGASPIVAEVAQEMGILTVGIVTLPFDFEQGKKSKAIEGVHKLSEHVDALLIIKNERLIDIYPDFSFLKAFEFSNDVVANAARAIAEIITMPGIVNTDFNDVRNTLKKGGIAILSVGRAKGENRITTAINNALNSPLMNTNNVRGAQRLLLQLYCSTEYAIQMNELSQVNAFVSEIGHRVDVQWGASLDEQLGEEVRVTIIATGYGMEGLPTEKDLQIEKKEDPTPIKIDESQETHKKDDSTPFTPPTPPTTPPQRPQDPDPDEIVIHIDDDDTPLTNTPNPPTTKPSGFGGWMRRRNN